MLQEPQLSSYDLQFTLFGFHVRVAWGFWILAAILGWQYVQMIDRAYSQIGGSPGAAALLVLWSASLFLSILVHELGHSFMHRRYGMDSRIVLYHFGGLAIPGSFTAWNAARRRFAEHPKEQIIISAAGPAAQFALALAVWMIATAMHVDLYVTSLLRDFVTGLPLPELEHPRSAAVYVLTDALVTQSVFWALFNLLPILPLDGGNIMREVMRWCGARDSWRTAALVSMITAALVGFYMFQRGQPGAGLMCLSFAASNYQLYTSFGPRGY